MMSSMMAEWWDKMATKEEVDIDDERINRLLRWREIERNLNGIETILDIGGATGAFSIPLAQKGYHVTHVDLSDQMIEIAKEKAKGLNNISFVKTDAKDLSMFSDRQFDLVLNLDGAVSFSGKDADKVICESCRVTGKKLLITTSNKVCMTATWLNYSINLFDHITPAVLDMMENGCWEKDKFETNTKIAENYFNIESFKAYSPSTLKAELIKNNMNVIFSRSLGSLTHLYLLHLYRQNPNTLQSENFKYTEEFVDLCEKFDREIMPNGPGSFRRAGVIALAERISK